MKDLARGEEVTAGVSSSAMLERSRALFEALHDERGVHLCEIALAQETIDPVETLQALLPPLERLAETRTLTGLDVLTAEILLAARRLGAREIEARARRLVAATGSMDLRARVFTALWERFEALADAEDIAGCLDAGWAALDLAVALDDYQAAAVSLVRVAGCHEALADNSPAHREAAILCLRQAARYLVRAGSFREAGDLFLDAAKDARSDAGAMIEEALRAYEEAGAPDRVADCRIALARVHLASGQMREAIRVLHKALGSLQGPNTLSAEVRVWEMLAEAHRRAGDIEAASEAETRARLLAGFSGS